MKVSVNGIGCSSFRVTVILNMALAIKNFNVCMYVYVGKMYIHNKNEGPVASFFRVTALCNSIKEA